MILCHCNNVTHFGKRNSMSTENLISKKELLERYSISYGALYRWKRMGLIPEDWFIRKSTVTGQETFFPEQLICERIELIKTLKDDKSLAELSNQFNDESQSKAVLTVKSVFGVKSFYISEIQSVCIDDGEGNVVDVTEKIRNISEG